MLLNQIIAVLNGKKTRCQKGITEVYHTLQREDVFSGLVRTYQPKDDEGDRLPTERVAVRETVSDSIAAVSELLTELIDAAATQEAGNQSAVADIVVDGIAVAHGVPVTTMLFLEKQLVDLSTFVSKLPSLQADAKWEMDTSSGQYRSEPVQTIKTKKVPRVQVLYDATDKHPAQVQAYNEDVMVGTWTATRFSGAIPATEKEAMFKRVVKLQEAVKAAREKANSLEIEQVNIAKNLLNYVFAG